MRIFRGSVFEAIIACTFIMGVAVQSADAQKNLRVTERPQWLADRWSWPFWWEVNRSSFLPERRNVNPVAERQRAEVSQRLLLIAADKQRSVAVREQAILAVGRLGVANALPKVKTLTQAERFEVARAAWLALGLIGGEEAKAAIVGEADWAEARHESVLARIIAMGLLEKLGGSELKLLVQAVNQGQAAEIQASALWALRQHNPPFLRGLSRKVLNETSQVRLAQEAILALGQNPHPDDRKLLVDLYYGTKHDVIPSARAAWDAYEVMGGAGYRHINSPPVIALRSTAAMSLGSFQFPEDHRLGDLVRRDLRRPYEYVDRPGQGRSLWRPDASSPHPEADDRGTHEIRWGVLSLGWIGYEDSADLLIQILREQREPIWFEHNGREPVRGFAALGLGLFRHRIGQDERLMRDDGLRECFRKAGNTLAYHAADDDEPLNLRAACLLALGLGGGDQAEAIHEALAESGGDALLLRGHGVLALALLGDRSAIKIALPLLPSPRRGAPDAEMLRGRWISRPINPAGMLGMRAALFGLGIVGNAGAKELAEAVIGRETYSSLAAAWALRQTGNMDVVDPLLTLLDDGATEDEQARMIVMVLGELLATESSTRLQRRLVGRRNITWPLGTTTGDTIQERTKDVAIYSYLRLADPFLYEVLIPLNNGPVRR